MGIANAAEQTDGGPDRQIVRPPGFENWQYAATKYGNSDTRHTLAMATGAVIGVYLPGGNTIKAIAAGIMSILGTSYDTVYFTAKIYTLNDYYAYRTKTVYYTYSDKARTNLIDKSVRYREVPKHIVR